MAISIYISKLRFALSWSFTCILLLRCFQEFNHYHGHGHGCYSLLFVRADDFIYQDFNQTLGLVFNGDATTSGCNISETFVIRDDSDDLEDDNDHDDDDGAIKHDKDETQTLESFGKTGGMEIKRKVETSHEDDGAKTLFEMEARFGHREDFLPSKKTGCEHRLRLTPSAPSKVGSVFYEKPLPVLKGFDTMFTFQVTDHSRVCSEHIGTMLSTKHHTSCAVHGGDGFAFVLHHSPDNDDGDDNDDNPSLGAHAIGGDGQELGYGGIPNSLAIEFDMWTNVDTQGSDDFFHDHISIHSASVAPNSAGERTKLGHSRAVDLADGQKHTARVQYLPYIENKYLESMTANDILLQYLKDNGEGRRLGTLAVFIDDGIEKNVPILAIPLNLSILLHLPQTLAYAGFTASTGENWENHDILDWHWCDSVECQQD